MDRRDFLRLSSLTGLGLATPLSVKAFSDFGTGSTDMANFPYFIINVIAAGGWDTTCLCDPKSGDYYTDDGINKGPINSIYKGSEIENAGRIRYAPISGEDIFGIPYSARQFFQKYCKKLLVINGVDMDTSNHETGTQLTWAGREARSYPTLPALYAAASQQNNALAYLSYGGYENTRDLVPVSRITNPEKLADLADPNSYPTQGPGVASFHTDATYERIKQAMQGRLARIAGNTHLPRTQQSALSLANAQMSVGQLQDLRSYLPDDLDELDNKVISQAKVIAAACKAGICNGANLYLGGFDTHSYHNSAHPKRLLQLLMAVDTLMDEARRFGIQDRMLVVMGSEFTRTPYYNDSEPAGKDHWTSNSFMLMGPGIEGDRVVGRTDNQLKPVPVPVSGPVIMPAGGTVPSAIIGAHDVHASLRTHLGLDGLGSNYPLDTAKFDFFA